MSELDKAEGFKTLHYEHLTVSGESICRPNITVEKKIVDGKDVNIIRSFVLEKNGSSVDIFTLFELKSGDIVEVGGERHGSDHGDVDIDIDTQVIRTPLPEAPLDVAAFAHEAGHLEQLRDADTTLASLGRQAARQMHHDRPDEFRDTLNAIEAILKIESPVAVKEAIAFLETYSDALAKIDAELAMLEQTTESTARQAQQDSVRDTRDGIVNSFYALLTNGEIRSFLRIPQKMLEHDATARAFAKLVVLRDQHDIDYLQELPLTETEKIVLERERAYFVKAKSTHAAEALNRIDRALSSGTIFLLDRMNNALAGYEADPIAL